MGEQLWPGEAGDRKRHPGDEVYRESYYLDDLLVQRVDVYTVTVNGQHYSRYRRDMTSPFVRPMISLLHDYQGSAVQEHMGFSHRDHDPEWRQFP